MVSTPIRAEGGKEKKKKKEEKGANIVIRLRCRVIVTGMRLSQGRG